MAENDMNPALLEKFRLLTVLLLMLVVPLNPPIKENIAALEKDPRLFE